MSNLGAYQKMTTFAKKFGGPKNFLAMVAVVGYAIGKGCEAGIKVLAKKTKHKDNGEKAETHIYTVNKEGVSNEGLHFNVGDKFCVLEADDDAILIELIGNKDNPYVVDINLLRDISDYK